MAKQTNTTKTSATTTNSAPAAASKKGSEDNGTHREVLNVGEQSRKQRSSDRVRWYEVVETGTDQGRKRLKELMNEDTTLFVTLGGQPDTYKRVNAETGKEYGSETLEAFAWLKKNAKPQGWAGKSVTRLKETEGNQIFNLTNEEQSGPAKKDLSI